MPVKGLSKSKGYKIGLERVLQGVLAVGLTRTCTEKKILTLRIKISSIFLYIEPISQPHVKQNVGFKLYIFIH